VKSTVAIFGLSLYGCLYILDMLMIKREKNIIDAMSEIP
jgi:hypothetical protein